MFFTEILVSIFFRFLYCLTHVCVCIGINVGRVFKTSSWQEFSVKQFPYLDPFAVC